MTLLDDETIRTLAGFRDADPPVTTCYLDVDGRRLPGHGDVEGVRGARAPRRPATSGRPHGTPPSVRRPRAHGAVRPGPGPGTIRGLAMFSCSAGGFWEVHELPVRVTNQLVVEPLPSMRQLEAVLEEQERIGVLLVDRQRARMYVFELGELVDHTERFDELVRHGEDDRGERVRRGSAAS